MMSSEVFFHHSSFRPTAASACTLPESCPKDDGKSDNGALKPGRVAKLRRGIMHPPKLLPTIVGDGGRMMNDDLGGLLLSSFIIHHSSLRPVSRAFTA